MPTKDRKGTQLLFKTKNGEYQLIPQPEAISLDAENVSDDNFSDYFKDMEISFEINEEESKRLTSFLWKYFNYYEMFDRATKDERLEDCLLVGYYKSYNGKDKTILTVGRKENDGINIIAWFENEKAEKLYKWLTREVDFECVKES